MRSKHLYLALCAVGTLLPWAAFLSFLLTHGLDAAAFADQLFGTPVSAFFGLDVIVSSLALWVFVFSEGRRLAMSHLWLPIAANLLVGLSLGLPLFLYMRERRREARP
jgi:hypothetical protein